MHDAVTQTDRRIIDGKAYARQLFEACARDAATMKAIYGVTPGLAVVLVGDNPASQVYVRNKTETEAAGMVRFKHMLPAIDPDRAYRAGRKLNADPNVDGILVQLPLPKQSTRQR